MSFDRIVYFHTLQTETMKKDTENQINIIASGIAKAFK